MVSVKEKKQIPEQSVIQKAFEVIGYNKNLGEITTFGMKMSTETTQTRISPWLSRQWQLLTVFPIHCKWEKLKKKFTHESHITT